MILIKWFFLTVTISVLITLATAFQKVENSSSVVSSGRNGNDNQKLHPINENSFLVVNPDNVDIEKIHENEKKIWKIFEKIIAENNKDNVEDEKVGETGRDKKKWIKIIKIAEKVLSSEYEAVGAGAEIIAGNANNGCSGLALRIICLIQNCTCRQPTTDTAGTTGVVGSVPVNITRSSNTHNNGNLAIQNHGDRIDNFDEYTDPGIINGFVDPNNRIDEDSMKVMSEKRNQSSRYYGGYNGGSSGNRNRNKNRYGGNYSPNYNPSYSPNYNQNYNPPYNPNYSPNYSPNFNSNYNPNYNPNYNYNNRQRHRNKNSNNRVVQAYGANNESPSPNPNPNYEENGNGYIDNSNTGYYYNNRFYKNDSRKKVSSGNKNTYNNGNDSDNENDYESEDNNNSYNHSFTGNNYYNRYNSNKNYSYIITANNNIKKVNKNPYYAGSNDNNEGNENSSNDGSYYTGNTNPYKKNPSNKYADRDSYNPNMNHPYADRNSYSAQQGANSNSNNDDEGYQSIIKIPAQSSYTEDNDPDDQSEDYINVTDNKETDSYSYYNFDSNSESVHSTASGYSEPTKVANVPNRPATIQHSKIKNNSTNSYLPLPVPLKNSY